MGDINKIEEECTHNCMTCGHGCAEGSDGVGKFEKALNKLRDIAYGCGQFHFTGIVDGLIESCAAGKIQCVVSHLDIKRFGFHPSVFDGEVQCHIFHFHFFQTRLADGCRLSGDSCIYDWETGERGRNF